MNGNVNVPGASAADLKVVENLAAAAQNTANSAANTASAAQTVANNAAAAAGSHTQSASTITAGTFAGAVVAPNDTAYTTYKIRNAAILSAVPSSMTNGTIAFVYS